MSNYATITDGNVTSSGHDNTGDMSRTRRRTQKEGGGQASMISSVINLLNTIVGAGTLAMPSVMSHMGIMLGVFMIVWSGLTAAFGLYLQSRCARYLDRGTSSFFALSQITYPNLAVIFDAAIAVKCFGVGVSYMIIIGDLMPGVVVGFVGDIGAHYPYMVNRNFWITAFMFLVIPLSFLRRLDSLKYTSVIALVSIGYLIVLVVYHFSADSIPNRGDVRIVKPESVIATLSSLPVVVFAYTCHQNMFSILNEIKDDSPGSIMGVVGSSIGSAACIYILVAITGYLTFGNGVLGDIVLMYPASVASTIGKAAIVVLVTFSIPLQVHPCRASLDAVLKWRPSKGSGQGGNARSSSPNGGGRPLLNPTGAPKGDHGSGGQMGENRFAILTTIILIFSYLVALSVSSLDRVLAIVGSTGSTSISFILPALFYYKISDPNSIHHQRLMKADDDAGESSDVEDAAGLSNSVASIGSAAGALVTPWKWRRRWRWDLEHVELGLLRKMAAALCVYGLCVMVVCLVMNIVFAAKH